MRRVRRIIVNALTLLSLLLCVGTCVLWGRSYFTGDTVSCAFAPAPGVVELLSASSCQGSVYIGRNRFKNFCWAPDPHGPMWNTYEGEPTDPGEVPLWRTFVFRWDDQSFGGREWSGIVPLWSVGLIFSALPALHLHQRRRERCKSEKLCPTCNYDLRATPGRCPECGAVPAAKAIA